MSNAILNLILYGLVDLTGSPLLTGFLLLIIAILFFAAIGLPILIIPVILIAFVVGIVQIGWLPPWAEAVFILIVGVIFFYSLYQLFKT